MAGSDRTLYLEFLKGGGGRGMGKGRATRTARGRRSTMPRRSLERLRKARLRWMVRGLSGPWYRAARKRAN